MNPLSDLFDPLKAAVLHNRQGRIDEAIWLVFLASHFGKHISDGWSLTRDIYGKLGGPGRWDWATISSSLQEFRPWLRQNNFALNGRRFSNHRKYESLNAETQNGTASVIESYVNWILSDGTHQGKIMAAQECVGQQPDLVFDYLYRSMESVRRFGRLGKFDFLTMLDKLGLAPISPGSAYLWDNATGPKAGSLLLFTGTKNGVMSTKDLDDNLELVNEHLNVGMQTLEDAVCNWQKSPVLFKSFRG